MGNILLLILTLHTLQRNCEVTDGRRPFGVKMCEQLCGNLLHCHNPVYIRKQLLCCLNGCSKLSKESDNLLRLHDHKNGTYGIFSRSGPAVLIKNKDVDHHVKSASRPQEGYVTVRYGKNTTLLKLHADFKIWIDAQNVCRSEGGNLVKIDSKLKQRAIKKELSGSISNVGKDCTWIGLSDPGRKNKYKWIDGTPLVYSNWYTTGLTQESGGWDEECVCMNQLAFMGLHWKDLHCGSLNRYICEIR